MKFEIDEESLKENAESNYKTIMEVKKAMKKSGLADDDIERTLIVSAYCIGAQRTVEMVNEKKEDSCK